MYIPKTPYVLKRKIDKLRDEIEALKSMLENPKLSDKSRKRIEEYIESRKMKLNKYLEAMREACKVCREVDACGQQ